MKISIYGSDYVGLVTGTCLAEVGNDVVCMDMDIDTDKIEQLKQGRIQIYEPGLEQLVQDKLLQGDCVLPLMSQKQSSMVCFNLLLLAHHQTKMAVLICNMCWLPTNQLHNTWMAIVLLLINLPSQ
jgi:UDP-glucose 6-dehydrogenase